MVYGLIESIPEGFFAAVLGQVQQVVACMSHRQVVFTAGCRLDDDM